MVWSVPVSAELLLHAQDRLIGLSETIVKGSGGAFPGFVIAILEVRGNINGSPWSLPGSIYPCQQASLHQFALTFHTK